MICPLLHDKIEVMKRSNPRAKRKNYSVLLENSFRKKFIEKAIRKFGSQEKLAKYLSSKIKSRHIIRENIKNWKKGKHYLGYNLFIPIDVIKELCFINKTNLKNVLGEVIKFNPPWFDPRNRKLLIKQKEIRIFKKNEQEYLDIYSILPKETLPATRSKERLPLFVKKDRHYVRLWSEASWRVSEIKLKRFIKLNELFFIGVAIYTSEGLTKSINYNDSISLGNSEPAIINFFIKWLNSFLGNYKLFFSVKYNGQNCNEKNIKFFWRKEISYLKKEHQLDIKKRPTYGSGLINNFGVLDVRISNTVLKSFILNLLDGAKKLALRKKEYTVSYLKGLLASEGSIYAHPVLKEVTVGCLNEKERKFIKKLLKVLGLTFCEGKNQFVITHWNSFFNLYKQNIFEIKQINGISKKGRFLLGFKNHQKTQRLIKLKRFENKIFTAQEWQKSFGLKRYISAHNFLRSLIKENIISFYFEKNIKYHYINPEAKPFLESIWRIKNYKTLTI